MPRSSGSFRIPWQSWASGSTTKDTVFWLRTHATELFNLVEVERHAYLDEMCQLARAIAAVFKPHKMNYELLGNQVPHLHWHLFPRSVDDPQRLQAVWLAIDRAEQDEGERRRLSGNPLRREATAKKLRDKLREISP